MPEAQESVVGAVRAQQKIHERILPILTAASEQEVADFLRSAKDGQPYRGQPGDSLSCPIARFVEDQVQWLPGPHHVEVDGEVKVFVPASMWPENWEEEYDGPYYLSFDYNEGAVGFIHSFDEGHFPDLIEGE